MIASNTENSWCSVFLWSETWTSYIESTDTSELNRFLNLGLRQPWRHMTHSMISWGWSNLMWPMPPKCLYLLARNATYSESFERHLQRITLFHLARRWLFRCGARQCRTKILIYYPIKSFLGDRWRVSDLRFMITNYYKRNSETTWPHVILITSPPPNKLYTHLS